MKGLLVDFLAQQTVPDKYVLDADVHGIYGEGGDSFKADRIDEEIKNFIIVFVNKIADEKKLYPFQFHLHYGFVLNDLTHLLGEVYCSGLYLTFHWHSFQDWRGKIVGVFENCLPHFGNIGRIVHILARQLQQNKGNQYAGYVLIMPSRNVTAERAGADHQQYLVIVLDSSVPCNLFVCYLIV